MQEIGSSNIDKYSKFLFWLEHGYCPRIDELPLDERLKKIKMGPMRFERTTFSRRF